MAEAFNIVKDIIRTDSMGLFPMGKMSRIIDTEKKIINKLTMKTFLCSEELIYLLYNAWGSRGKFYQVFKKKLNQYLNAENWAYGNREQGWEKLFCFCIELA